MVELPKDDEQISADQGLVSGLQSEVNVVMEEGARLRKSVLDVIVGNYAERRAKAQEAGQNDRNFLKKGTPRKPKPRP